MASIAGKPATAYCCFLLTAALWVALELDAPSCSYFGYVASGWCGTNGIAEFSKPKNRRSSKC